MAVYQLFRTQKIPVSKDQIWDFISSPHNLKVITPPYMGFDVKTTSKAEKMYPGMIITYKVSPLLGIKLNWVTEITHVREKEFFVDEQRMGPYRLWHHQHLIEPIKGGVLMTDIVTYKPPFGFLGDLVHPIIIKNKLKEIFDFRRLALEERFGQYQG